MAYNDVYRFDSIRNTAVPERKSINAKTIIFCLSALATLSLSAPSQGNEVPRTSKSGPVAVPETVVRSNREPFATPDVIHLQNASTSFNALSNDRDPDGDRLVIVQVAARHGAVAFTSDGLVAYAQTPGPLRADTITYRISDGRGGLATGIVDIIVQ